MKKLTSLLLALMMILGLSTTALAVSDTVTLTIEDPYADSEISLFANTTAGREYVGYKLLNLTIGLKTSAHPDGCDGDNHTDGCYNYAYTVNEKYRTVLQGETYENGGLYLWENGIKPTNASLVTDEQILAYLANQSGDNEAEGEHGTLRTVADDLYRAIKTAGLAADETNMTGQGDEIEHGYWLIADVTNLTGHEANSLVVLDTRGQEEITVRLKESIPTIEKKVKDIENSEDDNISDNPWQDSADHDIGDKVPFKLTAAVATNVLHYDSYKIVFHDTLSDGLTLDPDSIVVYMYKDKSSADVDTDLNDSMAIVTNYFTKKPAT